MLVAESLLKAGIVKSSKNIHGPELGLKGFLGLLFIGMRKEYELCG